jgi:hypothetical protein
MNTEGTIVFPPTYYLETPAFRKLLAAHVPLIEAGYIKLLLGGPILSDYLDRKRSRYDKAAKFPHYYDAYYSDTKFHGLYDLPFQVTAKSQSIGHKTLASWTRTVLGRSQKHPRLVIRAQHFLDLAETTERSAILFENLREHQHAAGLSDQDALVLDYRSAMNRLYLINYLSLGFTVPETSRFVWDGITWHLPRSGLNLVALTRLAEDLQLKSRILHVDSSKLLTWRTKDTIRILFRSARELLREGKSLTNLVIDLLRRPSTDEIANAFV